MGEIVIYGNSTLTGSDSAPQTIYQASSVVDLTPVKKIAMLCKLKSGATLNQTNYLFSSGIGYNSGGNNFRLRTNTLGELLVGSRTSTNNSLSVTAANGVEFSEVASYVNVTNLVAQTSKNFRNGSALGSEFSGIGSAWNFPRSLSPTVQGFGTDGLDWSFFEAHLWVADEDDPFPVDSDWVAFNSGTPAAELSVAPSHSWVATGTNGAIVTEIIDTGVIGGLHLYKTQGPTSGARAPTYLGDSASELSVASVSVGFSVDSVGLSQANTLGVSDLSMSSGVESLDLSISGDLSIDEMGVALGVDALVLQQASVMAVASLAVEVELDEIALTQANILTVADASAAVAIDSVVLSTAGLLAVNDLFLITQVEGLVLQQASVIAVADLSIQSANDSIALAPNSAIVVADSSLSVSIDSVVLNQSGLLVVDNASLAISAESPVLNQQNALAVNDSRLSIFMDSLTIGGGVFVTESALGMIIRDFQYVLLVEG